jgi:hypothetical protein
VLAQERSYEAREPAYSMTSSAVELQVAVGSTGDAGRRRPKVKPCYPAWLFPEGCGLTKGPFDDAEIKIPCPGLSLNIGVVYSYYALTKINNNLVHTMDLRHLLANHRLLQRFSPPAY